MLLLMDLETYFCRRLLYSNAALLKKQHHNRSQDSNNYVQLRSIAAEPELTRT